MLPTLKAASGLDQHNRTFGLRIFETQAGAMKYFAVALHFKVRNSVIGNCLCVVRQSGAERLLLRCRVTGRCLCDDSPPKRFEVLSWRKLHGSIAEPAGCLIPLRDCVGK